MIPDSAHIVCVSVADSKLSLLIFLSQLASLSQGDALRSSPRKPPRLQAVAAKLIRSYSISFVLNSCQHRSATMATT